MPSVSRSITILTLIGLGLIVFPWPQGKAGHAIFRSGAVGGVSIDAAGVVREANVEALQLLLDYLKKTVKPAEGGLAQATQMRKVSLRGLEAAIRDALENNFGQLPEEVQFMGGLTRLEFVLVDRENHDIILAGPAEAWRTDEWGNVVGVETGRPMLRLDDFLVALRTVDAAREVGISCSIDPTPEGLRRYEQLMDAQRRSRSPVVPDRLGPAIREAMGPQTVTVTGVPANTHFARVMVAADFHMKRLAMGVVKSPVAGFPSFVELLARSSAPLPTPRWWLACNYDAVERSEDKTVWRLKGQGVKTLTEENLVDVKGRVQRREGQTSPLAEKWARLMTEKYDELSVKMPIFAELRNLMDMCVVAAIIEMHDLRGLAQCDLPLLYGKTGELPTENWNAPKTVDTVCTFAPTRGGWLVTTAGGVQIESWPLAEKAAVESQLDSYQVDARRPEENAWWWN
ncbi:MAG: hypothetical protein KatS3mg110_4123 [Pirellulaceae bacterium]|nr:MAG: hypothetical protein KatS3mg110_4123 [Pirellulaceae bacterium]